MHFALNDLIADITQNGAESGAELVELSIEETYSPQKAEIRFMVRDNGKGMDEGTLRRATDPFVTDGIKHPHRKVGLGLPFLIQTAEQSGGGWNIESALGKGTTTTAWFDLRNIDTPPFEDIPGLFRTVLMFDGPREMFLHRVRKGAEGIPDLDYDIRKTEILDALGSLDDAESLILLKDYLQSLEEE
ncbi:MAG: ATP-binding protein [Treponema sp.]|nr:ATP-binding protein [Treponema sp.]